MKALVFIMIVIACGGGRGGGVFTGDGGTGAPCGGFGGGQCAADEFCDFVQNTCGFSDESGTCKKRPVGGCPELFDPVCGCDGTIHSSICDAQTQGVDLDVTGTCPVTPGNFACGARECTIADHYCRRFQSDIGGEPDSFQCNALPIGCSSVSDCACVAGEPCGGECSGDGATGFTLTCFGG